MNNLEEIAAFAASIHAANDDGHGFEHIERVVALADKILATEPSADRNLVLAASYLHDSYDEKLTADSTTQREVVRNFLLSLGLTADKVNKILYIIDNMSFSSQNFGEAKPLDINGQIVQDADRLEAMGATMIVRTLEYGWAHNRVLYDPEISPQDYRDKSDYHKSAKSTTINHFYEKAFRLQSLLNTKKAQEMGAERDKIMHAFVVAYEQEYRDAH